MNRHLIGLCLSSLILLSGCKEPKLDRTETTPVLEDSAALRITGALNHTGTPYSFQEDIVLKVSFKNLTAKEITIPHLPAHPATWEMRNNSTGMIRVQAFRPPAPPGLPLQPDPPEASLPPGGEHVYLLQIQAYLGDIPPGQYALKYRLDTVTTRLRLPWLEFEVSESAFGSYSLTPSNQGNAKELWLAWQDRAVEPARILWRRAPMGDNRNLPPRIGSLGTGEVTSGPVVSTTARKEPATAWVGWLKTNRLHLARESKPDSFVTVAATVPEPGPWTLVEPLQSGGLAASQTLSGALTRTESDTLMVVGFTLDAAEKFKWEKPIRIPGTPVLPPKLVSLGKGRMLAWVESNREENQILLLPWIPRRGFGPLKSISRFPIPAGTLQEFEVKPDSNTLVFALAIRPQGQKEDRIEITRLVVNPRAKNEVPGKRSAWTLDLKPSISARHLTLDGQGHSWLLQAGPEGCWVQSEEWKTATFIEKSEDMIGGRLYFKKGVIPQAILLGKKSGFQTRGVMYPDGSDTSDDWVEDNE